MQIISADSVVAAPLSALPFLLLAPWSHMQRLLSGQGDVRPSTSQWCPHPSREVCSSKDLKRQVASCSSVNWKFSFQGAVVLHTNKTLHVLSDKRNLYENISMAFIFCHSKVVFKMWDLSSSLTDAIVLGWLSRSRINATSVIWSLWFWLKKVNVQHLQCCLACLDWEDKHSK